MYDIFISHSSKDKQQFVCPLANELTKAKVKVWLDQDKIEYGDELKTSIISGIHNSLIFVIIISENYFSSNWSSLELGVLQNECDYKRCVPIIFEGCKQLVAEKYPFLLQYKYIILKNNINEIADTLINLVNNIRRESSFYNLEKTDLKMLAKELRSYNHFKLDEIAINVSIIVKDLEKSCYSALKTAVYVCKLILESVARKENIYIDNTDVFETINRAKFLNENLEAHFQYIYSLQKELSNRVNTNTLTQSELYLFELSLYSIIDWYRLSYYKKPILNMKGLYSVCPQDITEDDINEIYNIETFSLPPALIASTQITKEWYDYNPFTIIGARDKETQKLVGFIHTIPVTDEYYEQIRSGNFDDTKISLDNIRQYDMQGFYKLYLSSFCIHPKYNATQAFGLIYTEFIDFLLALATERGIFISHIIADGATQKGATLCKHIGMQKVQNSIHDTTIYEAILLPPALNTIRLENKPGLLLMKYYQNKYEEYKEIF